MDSPTTRSATPDLPSDKVEEKSKTSRFWSEKKGSESQLEPMDHWALAKEAGIKPAFLAKVDVLNEAIREIGMGRFQYELFFTAGELQVFL
jgi:hypothetical protein